MTTTTVKPEATVDKQRQPEGARGWKETVAVWTARVVTLAAFWSLISIVINGAWAEWIDEIFGLVNIPTDASLFTVVLLFVLGNALSRRIRFALWIVIFMFQLFAVLLGLLLADLLTVRAERRDHDQQHLRSGSAGPDGLRRRDRPRPRHPALEGSQRLSGASRTRFATARAAGVRWRIDRLGGRGDRPHRGVPQ